MSVPLVVCTPMSGSLGELLPLEPRPGRLNCKEQFLQSQHKNPRALAASQSDGVIVYEGTYAYWECRSGHS